jgi:hypothetical protein
MAERTPRTGSGNTSPKDKSPSATAEPALDSGQGPLIAVDAELEAEVRHLHESRDRLDLTNNFDRMRGTKRFTMMAIQPSAV